MLTCNMDIKNLFHRLPVTAVNEVFENLLETDSVRIERITSEGHVTAPGVWLDQDWDEWVLLLTGSADLLFFGESGARTLTAGDYIYIPAHRKHRVERTDRHRKTIWLAVHIRNKEQA